MWSPYNDFPREYGIPNRMGIVETMSNLTQKINLYNTKTTFFTSLYAFDETKNGRGVYSSARIKQIYFDMDSPQNLEPALTLHKYCLEHNLLHCINFSGGGFHFYIATKYPSELKNKKAAVGNAQIHIADKLNLKVGVGNGSDIDAHIIGNIAQLVRPPTTYNLKRNLYCFSLSSQDLKLSLEEIKEKAKKQIFGIHVFGKEYLDLTPFDTEAITRNYDDKIPTLIQYGSIGIDAIDMEKFPPCVKFLMTEKLLSHRQRYILILYFRELGLSISDTIELLRGCLNPKTFIHCVVQERQPYWVYRRTDLTFPSCQTLLNEGLCPDKTCKGANLY